MKKVSALVGALVLFGSQVTLAEEAGGGSYIGVNFGSTSQNIDGLKSSIRSAAESEGVVISSESETTGDSGYKLFYGYKFTPSFAVELFYADLGQSEIAYNGTLTGTVVDTDSKIEASSYGAYAAYQFNSDGSVKPFVKLGFHNWNLEANASVSAPALSLTLQSGAVTDSGTDFAYGLGLDVSLTENLSFRAEYEMFDMDNSAVSDVSMLSAGLNYRF